MANETNLDELVVQKAPPGSELLKRLQLMEGQTSPAYTTLLLLSVGVLPLSEAEDVFWRDFDKAIWNYKERYNAAIYEISPADRAFLVKVTDANQVRILSDLKVEILRLIQSYFPENFGMIDQSRLLRTIDLRFKLSQAIRFLEKLAEMPGMGADKGPRLRRLQEEDISRVLKMNKDVGSKEFVRIFVQHQSIAMIQPGNPPLEVMKEYFIAMGALKKHVFDDVELRGSGNLFNQLTITLDQVLMKSFGEVNPGRAKCSINLNVETVFTKAFESFLGRGQEDAFANIVFEFRQSNILQHFDEYEVASELIRSKGGTIAVDAIYPEALGIVNLARLNANMAKVFWRPGADVALPAHKQDIAEIQKSGTVIVMARVDEEAGIEIGHQLGITMYQGFLVDGMLK